MAVHLTHSLMLTLAMLSGTASAQQQAFSREEFVLHYVWQYETATTQTFTLQLPSETALPAWSAWRPEQADAFVFQQLLRDAEEQFPDVKFRYVNTINGSTVDFQTQDKTRLPEISNWLSQQQTTLLNAYLDQHYYKRHGGSGSNILRPDHVRIATDSSSELLETAQALQQIIISTATEKQKQRYQNDEKSLVSAGLLNFVQSIPYDPLESMGGLRGVGFLMPEQVLIQNRGDCDSKSTLLMSLLMALYPDLEQAIVYVPDHAFLAIRLTHQAGNEEAITIDSLPFIPLEVTGPAEIPPGMLGEKSRLSVNNNQYQYERIQPITTNSTPN